MLFASAQVFFWLALSGLLVALLVVLLAVARDRKQAKEFDAACRRVAVIASPDGRVSVLPNAHVVGSLPSHGEDPFAEEADKGPVFEVDRVPYADQKVGVDPMVGSPLDLRHPADARSLYKGDGGPSAGTTLDMKAARRLYDRLIEDKWAHVRARNYVRQFYPTFGDPHA